VSIDPAAYAAAVVQVLREHLPDFDPEAADGIAEAVERNARHQLLIEFIVDSPWSARWRLKASNDDRRRVRLGYFPVTPPGSAAGNDLERAVNEALRALETTP
jgi:hypothetical protein